MTLTLAQKVFGVVITSSPGPVPSATRAQWSAAVHELNAAAPGALTNAANCSSSFFTRGPVVIQPDRKASTTAATSVSSIDGGLNGRKVARGLIGVGSRRAYESGVVELTL